MLCGTPSASAVTSRSRQAARVGSSGEAVYAFCKGGLLSFSKTMARELARKQINVNVVCPGYIEGGLPAEWTPEHLKALKMQLPMRRFAKPAEIAAAVFFLASPDASYITGSTLKIDGGLL